MSAIVGERDRLLEAAVDFNLTPRQGKDLSLTVDASSFHVAVDGTPTPAFVTFTAHKIDLAGEDNWVASNGATLTGSGLTRILAYSAMPGANTTVTLTTVEDGQIYTAKAFIGQVKDGLPGAPADPADISAATLLTTLEGQITESQLFADLKSKIDLVTDPVSVAGSVQARIKAETDARIVAMGQESQERINAISQEVDDRISAVLGEANARATYVQNYTYSKQETTQALSIQASQIAAAWTSYTDQKTGEVASIAAADVRNYSYSKATADSSIAASESRLRAEFVGSGGATEAFVTNYAYSRAYIDGAEASQSSALTTSLRGYADAKKSEAITAAAADVRNYAYSKSDINAAEAAQSSTLTANFSVRADAARDAAINSASADVRNYSYAKSATDSAIAAAESRLRSEFVGSGGATEAYVTNYAYSKAQIDQAEALQSSVLMTGYTNAVAALPPLVANMIPRNSLPSSLGSFSAGSALAAAAWEGPIYASPGEASNAVFSPRNLGVVYVHAFGTPVAGSTIDMYLNATFADRLPVVAGNRYEFSCAMAAPRCIGRVVAVFYNAVGTAVGEQAGSAVSNNSTYQTDPGDSFPRSVGFAVAPPTAVRMMLLARLYANGGNDAYLFASEWYSGAASATQTVGAKYTDFSPAGIDANITGAQSAAIVAAAADVRQYAYAKSDAAGAFASQSSQLTAAYTTYADAGKAQAIAAAAADIRNYSYSKATVDGAIASSTSSLTTTVGNHTATLQSQSTSLDGLSTQFTLKSDINGYITGYGFASSANSGNPTSAFIINAGAFSVVAPDAAPKTMFTVGLVNGVAQMVMRGDVYADGAITARALRIGSFDNIVPDPKFYDLGWWGRIGNAVGQWADAGLSTSWLGGASIYLGPADNVEHSSDSQYFPIERGATYKITFQLTLSSDFVGQASVYWLFPGESWWAMRGGYDGGAGYDFGLGVWPDGLPVHFDTSSPKGTNTFVTTLRAADVPLNVRSLIRIRNKHSSGTCEMGAISIVRMSDNTLITDQGITTPKLATRAVVADKIESDAIQTRHVASDTMEARHLKSDVVQARHMTANSIVTDSIIANGISSLDRVYTTSYTFTSVRNFKLDLTVTQEGVYNAESGVTSGGWILERYTDQGAGLGYWTTLVETHQGGLYSDTLDDLGASTNTNPYYRISAKSGTGAILARIWKVFK